MKYKHFFSKRAGWLYVPTVRNFAGFILIKKTPQKLIVVCCLCCWKAPKLQESCSGTGRAHGAGQLWAFGWGSSPSLPQLCGFPFIQASLFWDITRPVNWGLSPSSVVTAFLCNFINSCSNLLL